jgi:hypothetical protein
LYAAERICDAVVLLTGVLSGSREEMVCHINHCVSA